MHDIIDIYNYFNDSNDTNKTFLELKNKLIDDFKNYEMYLKTYDDKYKLNKVLKTKTKYFNLYINAINEINEYIKRCDNPDINVMLNCTIDNLEKDYQDDYAKYYLHRLLIEKNILPYYAPFNQNMTKEARKLLNYLKSIEHKKIITGQHTQTVGQEELTHIKKITGYYPKLVGYELLALSQNINPNSDRECLEEVEDNKGTMQVAMYDKTDSIITFTWHMFSPLYGCGKSFYSENTEFDIRNIFIDDSVEYKAFMNELDHMSKVLKHFYDLKKPILFRPYHEADGSWFWWGKYGVEYAKKLYILTYKYFVNEKGLNNLIWVWNSIGDYPGDEYVDIISADIYLSTLESISFDEIINRLKKLSDNKMIALAECDVIPELSELKKRNFPFIYYMTWSKEFSLTEKYNSNEKLKNFYKDKDVIKN